MIAAVLLVLLTAAFVALGINIVRNRTTAGIVFGILLFLAAGLVGLVGVLLLFLLSFG
ncbi:hypothetical protein [Clavibacter michiganensis]|uniref:hypothetical protein n=1 Tax=Clavibacter michiganensis TaxID=28447 RepID=UPI003DA079B7